MPKIPDNPEDYFAALPASTKEMEAKYGKVVEKLRTIAPELVARHEMLANLQFNNEAHLDELMALIGEPVVEPE